MQPYPSVDGALSDLPATLSSLSLGDMILKPTDFELCADLSSLRCARPFHPSNARDELRVLVTPAPTTKSAPRLAHSSSLLPLWRPRELGRRVAPHRRALPATEASALPRWRVRHPSAI